MIAAEKLLLERMIRYGKQSSVGIMMLSIIDIVTGILSLFITALAIPAIAGSVAVLFKVSKTAIQYKKLRTAAASISPIIAAYIAARKKENIIIKGGKELMEKAKNAFKALGRNWQTVAGLLSLLIVVVEWLFGFIDGLIMAKWGLSSEMVHAFLTPLYAFIINAIAGAGFERLKAYNYRKEQIADAKEKRAVAKAENNKSKNTIKLLSLAEKVNKEDLLHFIAEMKKSKGPDSAETAP